jgi:hypothetical protein
MTTGQRRGAGCTLPQTHEQEESMALRPDELALPETLQTEIDKVRKIDNYSLKYLSEDFPLLAFVYATLAGGEHTIYCDHTRGFAERYLTQPLPEDLLAVFTKYQGWRGKTPRRSPTTRTSES